MSSNCLATIGRTYKFIAKNGLHGERCRPFIFLKDGQASRENSRVKDSLRCDSTNVKGGLLYFKRRFSV